MSKAEFAAESALLEILQAGEIRDPAALDRLFTSFYDELHRTAQSELKRGVPVTLSPTTLLHETFLNISRRESIEFVNRHQFIYYAARAMRGLIIDYFRNRRAQKRGGRLELTALPTELPQVMDDSHGMELDKMNDALEALGKIDARLAECVDLKFFCGLSFGEIADLRDVSERTVQRDWDKARLLLKRLIEDPDYDSPRDC